MKNLRVKHLLFSLVMACCSSTLLADTTLFERGQSAADSGVVAGTKFIRLNQLDAVKTLLVLAPVFPQHILLEAGSHNNGITLVDTKDNIDLLRQVIYNLDPSVAAALATSTTRGSRQFIETTPEPGAQVFSVTGSDDTQAPGTVLPQTNNFYHIQQRLDTIPGSVSVNMLREKGRLQGYKIVAGSFPDTLAQVGLQTDDIITAINGVEFNSITCATEIAAAIKHKTIAQLNILRDGKTHTLAVDLKKTE
ncbi:hypothetical protein FKG94_24240 [Exilibacterium tricleocarpae]|uniref:PDZ domain-containing protein n=1 Tax=Exilibacterium tricleocarpae TaxID=2591008 RepID=A0A545SSU6_9GAMM|nr:hypothetical protein [Exilibacterium tricleocarpae]TQV68042.1 hypothetical protein FKG94_24240 [Exilibacterium tricleocarpae]